VKTLVIDASIAIKWVVEEDGAREALAPHGRYLEAATRMSIEIDHPAYDCSTGPGGSSDDTVCWTRCIDERNTASRP
jgi:hypothetical protein